MASVMSFDDLTKNPDYSSNVKTPYSDRDWRELLSGAMASSTAAFAEHPCDKERAHWMIKRAAMARASLKDIEKELSAHIERVVMKPENRPKIRKEQLGLLRRFFRDQRRQIKRGWIIYKVDGSSGAIVHVLRSRLTPDKALESACLIYEANEISSTAKFLCAKHNSAKPYPIREWRKKIGEREAAWPGEYRIGEQPTYVLRFCETVTCSKGFDPDGELECKPAIPPKNFGVW